MNLAETLFEARRVSVPLVYGITTDPANTIYKMRQGKVLTDLTPDEGHDAEEIALLTYDIALGLNSINPRGELRLNEALNKAKVQRPQSTDPNVALQVVACLPAGTLTFYLLMLPDQFFKGPKTLQQVWNLRDQLKSEGSMLVFLGPDVTLPIAIAGDIMMVRDPRPNLHELEDIVKRQHVALTENNPDVAPLSSDDCTKAALSLQGLSPFAAETAAAISFQAEGIDFLTLREQRYEKIEMPGLKVWKGNENIEDLVGLDGVIDLLLKTLNGKRRPGAVFFIDEINHEMAGVNGGDLSGMADKYLAQLLTYMENLKVQGFIFLGPPGTGKTEVSKAIGNAADILTMAMDLGACKNHLMGSSEQNLRAVLDTATAVSGGVPLFLASCNDATALPTSLLRRFRVARVFFDLPGRAAKDKLWQIKLAKYELAPQVFPADDEWTGSDIEICAERAWMFNCSLVEAARSVIPIAKAKPDELAALRREAHGKFLDAATGTAYQIDVPKENKPERKIRL